MFFNNHSTDKGEFALNYFRKALLPVLLIVALLVAAVPAFAEAPASTVNASVTVKVLDHMKIVSATYNAKKQTPTVKVYDTDGKRVNSKYYKVKVSGYPKKAGEYTVTVSGKGVYTGKLTGTFVIKKANNPFWIKIGKTDFRRKYTEQSTRIKVRGLKGSAELGEWKTTSKSKGVIVRDGRLVVKANYRGKAVISITAKETENYMKTTRKVLITVM